MAGGGRSGGSIRELGPDRWELRVFLGRDSVTGRPQTQSKTIRGSKRTALAELERLAAGARDSATRRGVSIPDKLTLTRLIELHLERFDGSPTTLDTYRGILRNHIRSTIGRCDAKTVTPKLLDDFYAHLTREGYAAGTVRQTHAVIRGALQQGVRWGWLTANPARDATLPKKEAPQLTLPTSDQVSRMLHEANALDPAFGVFLRVSAVTGARKGEVCGLRWTDLDVKRHTLVIERSIAHKEGVGPVVKDTKNHGRRTISLDTATIDELRAHRISMEERARSIDMALGRDAFIFSNEPDGVQPWKPHSVNNWWNIVRARVEAKDVRLHDLRHFQATMLLKAGIPVKNVAARIGHRDAATTLNIYAHFLEEVDEVSAGVVADLVNDAHAEQSKSSADSNEGATARRNVRRSAFKRA
jgi:integrase